MGDVRLFILKAKVFIWKVGGFLSPWNRTKKLRTCACFCFLYFGKVMSKTSHLTYFIEEKPLPYAWKSFFLKSFIYQIFIAFIILSCICKHVLSHTVISFISNVYASFMSTAPFLLSNCQLLQNFCSGLPAPLPILAPSPAFISSRDLLNSLNSVM